MVSESISPSNLKDRRQELRNQRRWQNFCILWRFFVVSALTGGIAWIMALPSWDIVEKEQVEVVGNQLMSGEKVHSLLSLSYPQPIWQLKTQTLERHLEKFPPIAEADISRQILPPSLTVYIQERRPVAIAFSSQGKGFIDEKGIFLPQSFYQPQSPELKQLSLKVYGFEPQYSADWQELYPLLLTSRVKIREIDWRNPGNLVLKTELGTVHCGSYSQEFRVKLGVLAQMRTLSSKVPPTRILYIDISNPKLPSVKLKPELKPKAGEAKSTVIDQ